MEAMPFRMTPDVIREVVQKHYRAGAYILGDVIDGEFVIRYVGRSDYCLQTRLLTHGYLYNCQYCIFSYAEDARGLLNWNPSGGMTVEIWGIPSAKQNPS